MSYVIENLVQYDLSKQDAAILQGFGLIVRVDEDRARYETTALVWGDLGLEGDRAYDLFDIILGRSQEGGAP